MLCAYHQWFIGMAIFSLVLFVLSLVFIPMLVILMPADYFHHRRRFETRQSPRTLWQIIFAIFKNIIGIILILAGFAMLVLPGQGIITLLIGISLTDFPGKYRIEKYFIEKKPVLNALNWIRSKANKPPLIVYDHD